MERFERLRPIERAHGERGVKGKRRHAAALHGRTERVVGVRRLRPVTQTWPGALPTIRFAFIRASILLLLPFSLLATGLKAAESDTNAFYSTNLVITCTNGSEFGSGVLVFRGDVRVLESQMYLECELLRVLLDTNNAASPAEASLTNLNFRVNTIIAETNLLLMAREATIIGDRAVYTASNEVVAVTGELVILETDRSFAYCTNAVVNRRTGEGYVVGWSVVEVKVGPGMGLRGAATPGPGNERRPPIGAPPPGGRERRKP